MARMPMFKEEGSQVLFIKALTNARLTKFDEMDWSAWAGAEGDAYIVQFHVQDLAHIKRRLEIEHWLDDHITVILDDNGLSFNAVSPVNPYSYHVQVGMAVGETNTGADDYWKAAGEGGDRLDYSGIPESYRELLNACSFEARPFVLQGIRDGMREKEQAVYKTPEHDALFILQDMREKLKILSGEVAAALEKVDK